MRRLFDVFAAIIGLFLLSIIFLLIAIVIKFTDNGHIFYRAKRTGLNGKIFHLFKFRTMVIDADKIGAGITSAGDNRITPIGKVLRKYKLDELPQLFNIISGDMNLVGPRPEDPRYTALYNSEQAQILNVRPGITSPASLTYKDESSILTGDNWEEKYIKEVMPEKLSIDLKYFKNNTPLNDIGVIFKTIIGVSYFKSNLILFLFFSLVQAQTQSTILPLDHQLNIRIARLIYFSGNNGFHSSIQPYELSDLKENISEDSLLLLATKRNVSSSTWLSRKIFDEHLLEYKNEGYRLVFDFLPEGLVGYDISNNRNSWLNTRGFSAKGNIGDNVSFYSEYFENQAKFPGYIDLFINKKFIIPGQGYSRVYGTNSYDFGYASGVISYSPSQYFNFQVGQGKNFIGDGYRSMLLSDVSTNYPFFKFSMKFEKVKYITLWSGLLDIGRTKHSFDSIFDKKFSVVHYLDINVTNNLTIGLFESIIWRNYDSTTYRGFELNYVNPIIFLRPIEFSLGSPDNALMGINMKYAFSESQILYGQCLLDELTIGEYFPDKGYWANKYGVQFGTKILEPLGFKDLFIQFEFNTATPYTYSHFNPISNYGHYNQSLAHPLGANFYEYIGIFNYFLDRFTIRAQLNYSIYGTDSSKIKSVGQDIFRSNKNRVQNYGNYIGQGVKNIMYYGDFRVAYILNPIINLRIEASLTLRTLDNPISPNHTTWFSLGISSSFRNIYYDL